MNKTKTRIIDELGKIAGPENVLSDIEDLHVYSFEQIFKMQLYPKINLVLRVDSSEQAQKALELAKKKGLTVICRSTGKVESFGSVPSTRVLLDDVAPPQLKIRGEAEENERIAEYTREIYRAGQGTLRNAALALKALFTKASASKCLDRTTCSGYCTVSPSFNDVETWSSKGRALLIRGFCSGELQPSKKLVDVLYSCSLCGLCFAECFEDTEVRKAILDTRRRIAQKGLAPDLFIRTAKNVLNTGDVSGTPMDKRLAWLRNLPVRRAEKADVLYWIGCVVATRTPNTARAVVNILGKADVDFTVLGEKEGCCGYVLLASGLWNEAKDVASRMVKRVRETGAGVLVTSCAGCYYTFSKLYPEVLNVEMPCEVMHASQFANDLIKNGQLELKGLNLKVTYHDPCSLGRHSNVFDEPRDVLKAVPDLRLVEMPLSKRRARCCGAGGGLWSFNYPVSVNSGYVRLANDVVSLEVDTLVTACPTCHVNFRHASVKKSLGVRIFDVMEIIGKSITQS
ncbi:MAG: (Fe-S)-binding protein [Candidatus Bathyarchaeota archaeon]|jgi:Fe-S oxidoreductase